MTQSNQTYAFQKIQRDFIAKIRNPQSNHLPRKLKIYRDILFNNISSHLANAFPVLHSILTNKQWNEIITGFFAQHKSHSPYFYEMPKEFLSHLEKGCTLNDTIPYLYELAHYEWVELALSISTIEIEQDTINEQGDLLTQRPVISPLAWVLQYQYPVHKISPDNDDVTPNWTYLIASRNTNMDINFTEVNAITAKLLEILIQNPSDTGEQALNKLAEFIEKTDRKTVITEGKNMLKTLHSFGIVLGTACH